MPLANIIRAWRVGGDGGNPQRRRVWRGRRCAIVIARRVIMTAMKMVGM